MLKLICNQTTLTLDPLKTAPGQTFSGSICEASCSLQRIPGFPLITCLCLSVTARSSGLQYLAQISWIVSGYQETVNGQGVF